MKRVLLSTVASFTLASATLFAQTDFSGTWVMNKAKSDFGAMPEQMVPEKLTIKIVSTETSLKTSTTQAGNGRESTTDASYVLDGKTPNANRAMGGEIKTVAKWDGKDITMLSSREVQGMTLNIDQRMAKVGADAILMTTKIAGTPMGDIVMKYHLDRATEGGAAAPAAAVVAPAVTAPAVTAPAAKAKATTNFVGSWKMNKAKSNFGQLPEEYQPSAASRVVTHDEKSLTMKSSQAGAQGEMTMDVKLKLDGSESVNTMQGAEVKSVAKWDGPALVVSTKREAQGMTLDIVEKWVKVSDTVMNVEMKIGGTPIGDLMMTYVFEKE